MKIKKSKKPVSGFLKHARDESQGSIAIIMALAMTALVGSLAVAIDIGYLRLRERAIQNMADAAAYTALLEKNANHTTTQMTQAAMSSAVANGFKASIGIMTPHYPPTSGIYNANPLAVEIIIAESEPRFFSGIWASGSITISARSVAMNMAGAPQKGSGCMMSLGTFTIGNNANLGTGAGQACQLVSNSTANPAMTIGANANVQGGVAAAGTISNSGNVTGTVTPGVAPEADPYAGVINIPKASAPACNGHTASVVGPLLPGHYCSGWNVGNGASLVLAPGVYYIDSSTNFGNNVTIAGTGVTLVFGSGATPVFGNNMIMSISAPTTGATAGIAITQYTDDLTAGVMNVGNNSNLYLTGAVYLPTKSFTVGNNGSVHPSAAGAQCTQLLANNVTISNNTSVGLANNCTGVGVQPFGTQSTAWTAGTPVPRVVE